MTGLFISIILFLFGLLFTSLETAAALSAAMKFLFVWNAFFSFIVWATVLTMMAAGMNFIDRSPDSLRNTFGDILPMLKISGLAFLLSPRMLLYYLSTAFILISTYFLGWHNEPLKELTGIGYFFFFLGGLYLGYRMRIRFRRFNKIRGGTALVIHSGADTKP